VFLFGYTVFMSRSEADTRLRTLSSWLPGLSELDPITQRITDVRAELRLLQAQAAEVRAKLTHSCPLHLTDLEMRFWPKVQIIDDDRSCWPWLKGRRTITVPEDYGVFRWVNPISSTSEVTAASRVALFLATGELPDHACHTCDHPPCCRPLHLYNGTHQDNMRDRKARGRYTVQPRLLSQQGTRNVSAKLTDDLVIQARTLARRGDTLPEVHAQVDAQVSPTVLRWAITGRTWKHLDEMCPPVVKAQNGSAIKGKSIPHNPPVTRQFSDDQIRGIRTARALKVPLKDLAQQHNVSVGMISAIEHRRVYAHVK
jgi:hypothetical protein